MITAFITSDSVTYSKYHFETFNSLWNYLSNLDYPISNFHLTNKTDDGNIYIYDLYLRMRMIDYVSLNINLNSIYHV